MHIHYIHVRKSNAEKMSRTDNVSLILYQCWLEASIPVTCPFFKLVFIIQSSECFRCFLGFLILPYLIVKRSKNDVPNWCPRDPPFFSLLKSIGIFWSIHFFSLLFCWNISIPSLTSLLLFVYDNYIWSFGLNCIFPLNLSVARRFSFYSLLFYMLHTTRSELCREANASDSPL